MTAAEVVARCRSLNVELTATADRLRFRAPDGVLTDDLKAEMRARKADIIAILMTVCPACGRPLDAKRRCWKCHDRRCEGCGRATGSAFIANCYPCGFALPDED